MNPVREKRNLYIHASGQYCTRSCWEKAKHVKTVADGKKLTRVCEQCGKTFLVYALYVNRGSGKYCSWKCYVESRPIAIECRCKECDVIFKVDKARFEKTHPKYCSKKCATKGKNNPRWLGGKSYERYCFKFNDEFKEHIREKFGRKCYLCSTTEAENKRKLSVHHIDYAKNSICNGKEWAFVPLCVKHHAASNYNRWYWFNLLINYWAMNPEISF